MVEYETPQRKAMRTWAVYLCAVLVSIWLNHPLRSAGQLGFYVDDYSLLGRFIPQGRPPPALLGQFLTDEPFAFVFHALRYRVLGANPVRHHVAQGILNVVNALLAFWLVRRLSASHLLSGVFLVLFLTWPNHGETLYWPSAIYLLLMMGAMLVAVHLGLRFLRGKSRAALAGLWIFYLVAIFTHEAAFGLPLVFAVLWLLEAPKPLRLRDGIRFLLPLVCINGAYLVVRQSAWFGFGDPERFATASQRGAPTVAMLRNVDRSLRLSFGDFLVRDTARWAGIGSLSLPTAAILGALLGAAALLDRRPPSRPEVARLGALGAAWLLAGYAPIYLYYIGSRHNYVPSLGACLLVVVAMFAPMAGAGRRGWRAMQATALAATGCLGAWFHAASGAEAQIWIRSAAYIDNFKSQLLQALPVLPSGATVVVLDLRGVPKGPKHVLDARGITPALRLWYSDPDVEASTRFIPQERDFRLHPAASSLPYKRLLLFGFRDEILVRKKYLLLDDGTRLLADAYQITTGKLDVTPVAAKPGQWLDETP